MCITGICHDKYLTGLLRYGSIYTLGRNWLLTKPHRWKYFVNISCNLRINTNHESYIDVKLFEKIKTVYNTIDFFGSYDLGDVSTYEIYKKKYQQFLQGERPVIDKYTGESLYIWESELNNYKIDQFTYYYFDMDGDNYPELCIQDEVSTLYIIKYEAKTDEILLWMRSVRAPIYVLGTKNGLGEAYIELNENGEWEFSLWLKKRNGYILYNISTLL